MIVLYTGSEAEVRAETAIRQVTGGVYRTAADTPLSSVLDDITNWIAQSDAPQCIVVGSAVAQGEAELEAYRSLRRMAKFNGLDVHLIGDSSVEETVDRVVEKDEDMEITAPGSKVGAQLAELARTEVMSPFERVEMDIPTPQEIMASSGIDEDEAREKVAWLKQQAVWANNLYQVNVEFMPGERAHLIIRRLDKQAIHNWQHFQEIKNQLLGPECEAVEVFPKESQLVDEKHHYHLWGFRSPEATFGIGFRVGRKTS